MIDCNGRVSRITIQPANKEGVADFVLELIERDGHASEIKGRVSLQFDDQETLRLNFGSDDKNERNRFSWSANLKSSSPGIYAETCVFGTYESPAEGSFLSNGVMVLWQFK